MTVFALLLAAGSSKRYGTGNKLLARLPDGRRVIDASHQALAQHPAIDAVGIVCSPELLEHFDGGPTFVVAGGASRPESCLIGLNHAPAESLVVVHDAARPFVSAALIDRVVDAAATHGAAIPVTPISDTVKEVMDSRVCATLDRSRLFRAQTPQACYREPLIQAITRSPDSTDEASALEAAGVPVHVVEGDEANVKITTMSDLPQMLPIPAVGSGFDIHAFSHDAGRKLVLGGVLFEGERGLDGHSDADVVLHALTDALLGAAGGGDIGVLFPNTDPSYAGADSAIFLRKAVQIVAESGGRIVSADITILAESPKLGNRREMIRARISQELSIPQRRVNVKATTMEGLGAIGRNEGIAAMASVSVLLNEKYEE